MAYSVVLGGGTLYRLTTIGGTNAVTVPAGITLSATRPPRFAVLGRNVLLTNNPLRSLCLDPDFVVRPMQLMPPAGVPLVSAMGVGTLSGTYTVKRTYVTIDPKTGALIAESDFSPESAPVTIAAALLGVAGLTPSPDASVTHHRLYRTLDGGVEYYYWIDVDIRQTSAADDLSDVLLPNLTAPRELGVGPGLMPATYMTHCVEWKNRLWAVGDLDVDTLRYSGEGIYYGWPATYGLDVKPIGADEFGITALLPRRDLLGVAKRGSFWKVSGGLTDDEGTPQFDIQREKEGKGCVGASLVVDDTGYFLGSDGFYAWGANGFDSPSDGKVRKWFATDGYFNRALFPQSFAKYNERYDTIELHLAAAGSEAIDSWVSFDRKTGAWYGPHATHKTGTASGFPLVDADSRIAVCLGGDDGTIYVQNQPGYSDDGVAIPIRLLTKFHDANTPPILKVWGGVTLIAKALVGIGRCLVHYRAGVLPKADEAVPITQTVQADMRQGTQTLPRVGAAEVVQLEITEDTDGAECMLYGYEIPYLELGNRDRR
jgi:hypothetical protein